MNAIDNQQAWRNWRPHPRDMIAIVTALWALLFLMQALAPSDLMDNDQQRPAAYALDAAAHGRWIVQFDFSGDIMSKPPLPTWLRALTLLGIGECSHLVLAIPSALATLATAWLVLGVGAAVFSRRTGLLAALCYLLSYMVAKQLFLLRTDPVFALLVFSAALLAWRAWEWGRGWQWFWLLGALATLTKGPLGLVFAASGLLARFGEKGRPRPKRLRGRQWPGLLLYLLLVGGWFALAWWAAGDALIDKMIRRELVGHAVGGGEPEAGLEIGFYKAPLYFLGRFAPWSLLTLWACWHIGRKGWRNWRQNHKAPSDAPRRLENFLFAQFLFALGLLALASERADHWMPLLPGAALLAARQLEALLARLEAGGRRLRPALLLSMPIVLFLAFWAQFLFIARPAERTLVKTRELEAFLERYEERVDQDGPPLVYSGAPEALPILQGLWRRQLPAERAARLLEGPTPVFIATRRGDRIRRELSEGFEPYLLMHSDPEGPLELELLSNVENIEQPRRVVTWLEPWMVELEGLELATVHHDRLRLRSRHPSSAFRATNEGSRTRVLHWEFLGPEQPQSGEWELAPGESRRIEFPPQQLPYAARAHDSSLPRRLLAAALYLLALWGILRLARPALQSALERAK